MTHDNANDPRENRLTTALRGEFLKLRDKPRKRWACIALALTFFALVLLVFYQSQLYIILRSTYIPPEDLSIEIKESRRLREEVVNRRHPPDDSLSPRIIPHTIFDGGQRALITRAANELINDPEVQRSFPNFDGLTIQQTDAIVVPLWKFENPYDWEYMGITEAAYVWSKNNYGNADGLTIRERPLDKERMMSLRLDDERYDHIYSGGPPRMTKDGTPRIFLGQHLLSEGAFQRLKFTLLHEFVHAHEVPGFKPLLNFVHNDLMYLPQYCEMMDKLNLDAEKRNTEYVMRLFMILLLGLTAWYIYLAGRGNFTA
jgi:hypothetical protein